MHVSRQVTKSHSTVVDEEVLDEEVVVELVVDDELVVEEEVDEEDVVDDDEVELVCGSDVDEEDTSAPPSPLIEEVVPPPSENAAPESVGLAQPHNRAISKRTKDKAFM